MQWFLFVKKQPGRKKDYGIIYMCVLFYCNQMETVTIVFQPISSPHSFEIFFANAVLRINTHCNQ